MYVEISLGDSFTSIGNIIDLLNTERSEKEGGRERMGVCMCVCVCVRVREREMRKRETSSLRESQDKIVFLPILKYHFHWF